MKSELLSNAHLKQTPARREILAILIENKLPLSAEEVSSRSKGSYDLSTIYRTLNSFVEKGICKSEISHNKETLYSLISDKDEHVLVCTECHKTLVLEECPYEDANSKLEKQTGFTIHDHNTEIYGICPDCLKKEGK